MSTNGKNGVSGATMEKSAPIVAWLLSQPEVESFCDSGTPIAQILRIVRQDLQSRTEEVIPDRFCAETMTATLRSRLQKALNETILPECRDMLSDFAKSAKLAEPSNTAEHLTKAPLSEPIAEVDTSVDISLTQKRRDLESLTDQIAAMKNELANLVQKKKDEESSVGAGLAQLEAERESAHRELQELSALLEEDEKKLSHDLDLICRLKEQAGGFDNIVEYINQILRARQNLELPQETVAVLQAKVDNEAFYKDGATFARLKAISHKHRELCDVEVEIKTLQKKSKNGSATVGSAGITFDEVFDIFRKLEVKAGRKRAYPGNFRAELDKIIRSRR